MFSRMAGYQAFRTGIKATAIFLLGEKQTVSNGIKQDGSMAWMQYRPQMRIRPLFADTGILRMAILEIKNIATVPEYQGKGYARALIEFIVNNYREQYAILQVGTGDSPLTIPFYEKCGFVRSHIISNFFTDNYDHPIYESGVQLVDMVYLQRPL